MKETFVKLVQPKKFEVKENRQLTVLKNSFKSIFDCATYQE